MAEPWIRVHANLTKKAVVGRCVEALGLKGQHAFATAAGLLVQFWGNVSLYRPDGNVSDLPALQFDIWAGWNGKKGLFGAFVLKHHVDADGKVKEWDRYAGHLREVRAREESPDGKSTYVYYAVDGDECKIGFSGNPWSRVNELRVSRPRLRLAAVERGRRDLESERHRQFESAKIGREWFHMTPDLVAHIGAIVAPTADTTESTTVATTKPSVASRANETRRDETKTGSQSSSSAADFAIAISVQANKGLAEHPTKPQPIARIIGNSGGSLEAAQSLIDAGVPLYFAEADFYRQAITHKAEDPITSAKYFVAGTVRQWQRLAATEKANNATRPSVVPAANDTRARLEALGEKWEAEERAKAANAPKVAANG
jgi:hypothetical protein